MKKSLKTVWEYVKEQQLLIALIVIAAVAYGGYTYWKAQDTGEELLTVAQGTFLQEVTVSGKVEAAKDVNLGFAVAGRVSRVSARVGDKVAAGTVLAELENGDTLALVAQREASLKAAEADLASLKSGTRPEEVAVAEADVRAKEAAVRQATQAIVDEIQDAYTAADNAIRVQVDQFVTGGAGTGPQLSFTVSSSQIESAVESGRSNMESRLNTWALDIAGLSAQSDVTSALRRAKEHLSAVSAYLLVVNSAISGGATNSTVTQATLDSYATDIGTARSSVNASSGALTTAETALINAESALVSAERALTLKRAGATVDAVRAEEARVAGARAAVDDARAQLTKMRITAPFSGTVTIVDAKVGQTTGANAGVITMISESDVRVETYIPELNVALLALGDAARVTLDAYGEEVLFPATIAAIDPAETVRDGVSTYRTLLTFILPDPRIRAGMTANVRIVTDTRDGVISIPQKLVTDTPAGKTVQVAVNGQYETRVVTVGAVSSLGSIEIVDGLKEGDLVVVVPKK
jgi:RND family efflux transporter MFP subunit